MIFKDRYYLLLYFLKGSARLSKVAYQTWLSYTSARLVGRGIELALTPKHAFLLLVNTLDFLFLFSPFIYLMLNNAIF